MQITTKKFICSAIFLFLLDFWIHNSYFHFIERSCVTESNQTKSFPTNRKDIFYGMKELPLSKDLKNTTIQEYNFSSLAPKVEGSIPEEVASNIKHFLFFVGTSRSGTSFVQRLLNSHPHAIISDEMGIFGALKNNKQLDSKKRIAEMILTYTKSHLTKHENGLTKGYLLSWRDKIVVVGDKKPPLESGWMYKNFDQFWGYYKQLQSLFGSVKVISMVRDPYEVVLKTILADLVQLRGYRVGSDGGVPYEKVLQKDKMTGLYQLSERNLLGATSATWRQVNVSVELSRDPAFDMKIYQMEDLIQDGRKCIYELCDWLNLDCFDNFVDYVMNHKLEASRSRKNSFYWPQKVKAELNALIRRYPKYYLYGESYVL